jgi:hypothetical protein
MVEMLRNIQPQNSCNSSVFESGEGRGFDSPRLHSNLCHKENLFVRLSFRGQTGRLLPRPGAVAEWLRLSIANAYFVSSILTCPSVKIV